MRQDDFLVPITEDGQKVLDLVKTNPKEASQLMEALAPDEQVSLVSHQAIADPKLAQELLFLLEDDKSKNVVKDLGDRTLFRIMKSQSSTHIGVLSLMEPDRVQSVLDLDQELFSAKGITDAQTAYHWFVSFLEENDDVFTRLLKNIDIKVVAAAFQDKIRHPGASTAEVPDEEEEAVFPADFLTKLDRGELKPDDLEVADEASLDILKKIHLVDEGYFNALVSIMVSAEDLKTRTAEDALDRIQSQVGDMSEVTEEADDMFVPLEE
jgi:hypothetical protein